MDIKGGWYAFATSTTSCPTKFEGNPTFLNLTAVPPLPGEQRRDQRLRGAGRGGWAAGFILLSSRHRASARSAAPHTCLPVHVWRPLKTANHGPPPPHPPRSLLQLLRHHTLLRWQLMGVQVLKDKEEEDGEEARGRASQQPAISDGLNSCCRCFSQKALAQQACMVAPWCPKLEQALWFWLLHMAASCQLATAAARCT